ncbi:MAG: LamG domain-containing protein [Proteobacteria bacterium]|nr:LamG domain-containing protein [Pseudomonadota bacterium]NBP15748.1 LamG domain-containing protein [bacterium]
MGEYVGYGSTPVNFGTSAYTFEFWFNWDGFVDSWTFIIDTGGGFTAYGQCGGFYINNPNTNNPTLAYYVTNATGNGQPGASWNTSTIIKTGTWYHVMVTRSGDNVRVYINGNEEGVRAGGSTWNGSTHNAHSGSMWINLLSTNFYSSGRYRGYVSSLRIVKNQVLTSGNFTPSKFPLFRGNVGHTGTNVVSSITGTEYIFMGGDRASYDDAQGGVITGYNNASGARLLPFGPFSPPIKYSQDYYGGSIYHDGSGDGYETSPAHSITVGTSNFTLEGWIYYTAWPGDSWLFNLPNSGSYSLVMMYMTTTYSLRLYMSTDGSSWNLINNASIQQLYPGQWYHLAFVRNGNNFNFYVDGISRYAFTNSTNFTLPIQGLKVSTQPGTPGSSTVNPLTGYTADVRFVLGDAVYTGNFTPPQRRSLLSRGSSLPYTSNANVNITFPASNVLYHLRGDSAGIVDMAGKNNFESLNTSRQISTDLKFGTGSMFFNGTNDYQYSPYNPLFNFCYDSFTIEAWINPITWISTKTIFSITGGSGNVPKLVMYMNNGVPIMHINGLTGASNRNDTSTAFVTANTWTHLAYVVTNLGYRTTGYTWYVNGANVSAGVSNVEYLFTTQPIYISYAGTDSPASFGYFHGYIDDLRVTKQARYTSNFTPTRARLR